MRRKTIIAVFGGILAALGATAGELTLAERGKPSAYEVVVSRDASPSENFAARELCEWVEKLTGTRLGLISGKPKRKGIYLNAEKPAEALGDEGFRLFAKDGDLHISGGARGVVYGAYELLERFGGIVWMAPRQTHVPTLLSLRVPDDLDDTQKPAIGMRLTDTYDTWSDRLFGLRLRNNEMTFDEAYGGRAPAFSAKYGKCHTFMKLVPVERYYDSHPEYFSMVKGKRLNYHAQLCLTNPDVFKIVLEKLLAEIAANKASDKPQHRNVRYYGVSQDDWNNYCECPNCAAIDEAEGSHAGQNIWFVNKLAEAVEKVYPDVIIETLAYMWTRVPPKNLRPRHNVMICLCTIECDFSKPMTESKYGENIDFCANVKKWSEITDHLYIWDYAANWRATPSPYPNLVAMAKNLRFYRDIGIEGFFEEGIDKPSASFTDLKGWVASKLMWNPDLPAGSLYAKFCRAYYGKAAPKVLEFIRLMQSQPIDETKTPLKYAVTVEDMPLTEEFLETGAKLWAEAAELAKDEPRQTRLNVAWGRFGVEYTRAMRYALMSDWKAAIVSKRTAEKLNAEAGLFERSRASARFCQRMLDEDEKATVSSYLNDKRLKGYLKALAISELAEKDPKSATIQDWAICYNDFPKSKTIARVEDTEAADGRAISISGDSSDWSVTFNLHDVAALDKGVKYRLKARVKLPKDWVEGERIIFGISDKTANRELLTREFKAEDATGGYADYELGEFEDEPEHRLVVYANLRQATLSIDSFEITKGK